jgi:ketosteroid isomerase-like protein
MSAEQNVATIQAVYEAFGKGDVETILNAVADNVDWATDGVPIAPWYGVRNGRDGVASFFADVSDAMEVKDFGLEAIGSSESEVFAFLRFAFRAKSTGKEASYHLHHYFRFNGEGKIEYYRGSEDSAQVVQALEV